MHIRITNQEKLAILLAFIIATGLSLLATSQFGLGVSSDGLYYLSSADNLAAGNGLIDHKGIHLATWPPLLPGLMAIISSLLGTSTLQAAQLLNVIAILAILTSTAMLIKLQNLKSPVWFYFGITAVAISSSFLSLSANLGSDLIFIVFTNWLLLAAIKYAETFDLKALVAMGLIVGFASVLRWIGVVLIGIGGLVIIFRQHKNWSRSLRDGSIFAALASSPFLIWTIFWNYRRTGTYLGPRNLAAINIPENIAYTLARTEDWFFPDFVTNRVPSVLILFLVISAILYLNKSRAWQSAESRLFSSPKRWILWIFVFVYLASVAITTFTIDHIHAYDDRYQLVAFIPILVLAMTIIDAYIYPHLKRTPTAFTVFASVIALAWLGYHGFLSVRFVEEARSEGVPYYNLYNVRNLHASSFMKYLIHYEFEPGIPIYTNDASALYLFTKQQVNDSPNTRGARVPENPRSSFPNWFSNSSYLVWFTPNPKDNYISPSQLSRFAELTLLHSEPDGAIYQVTPGK